MGTVEQDLREHDVKQARAEERFEAYGAEAIQSVVDDILIGRKVSGLAIHDFLDDMDGNDMAALLLSKSADDRNALLDTIRTRIEQRIREWCDQTFAGECVVAERVEELAKEAS